MLSIANDYNYLSNELTYKSHLAPSFIPCSAVCPLIRAFCTFPFSIVAFISVAFDMGPSSKAPSTLSIVFTSLAVTACAINVLLSCCFCRNINDKERTYLLANETNAVGVIKDVKCCEAVWLCVYPLLALGNLTLFIYSVAK